MKGILLSSLIGVAITLLLLAVAFASDALGYLEASKVVFWQNSLIQSLVPLHNIRTTESPVYEATPVNYFAFIVSISVGFVIYGFITYCALKISKRT